MKLNNDMDNNKDLTIEETFSLAVENHHKNNLGVAESLYNKVLKIDPNYTIAHYNLATIFQSSGHNQKAIKSYEKAIEIDDNHFNSYFNLGTIFCKLEEYQKSIKSYEKAIEINPNYKEAHNNLGTIQQQLGKYQKAIKSYEKAIEIDLDYKDAHFNLGVIFQSLTNHQKAISCYEKVIQIDFNYKGVHNNLGAILQESGEYQKSIKSYEKAIEIDPNYKEAHNNLGTIQQQLGKYQKAIKSYEKAIEIDPSYIDAHNNLGTLFKILGEYEKEFSCYEKAIEADSDNVNSINNLTSIFQRFKFDIKAENNKTNFKKLILLLFRKNNIAHNNIFYNAKLILFINIDNNQIKKNIDLGFSLLSNQIIQGLLKQELFHLMLQKSLIIDEFIEKLLIKLRTEILFVLSTSNKDILKEYLDFINSLAEQCWLNEYLYVQSEKEVEQIKKLKDKIENDKEVSELEMAILGCYVPLNHSKIITDKLLNYKSSNILFNDLINVQIREPLREIELKKSIESLDVINEPTSMKVRAQYEKNPYPRWRYSNILIPNNFFKFINNEILPNVADHNNNFDKPNILIAGCGTGSQTILTTRYKNAKILGIDFSLASLAYAKRKSEEFGIENIEYLHADILQLKKLNKKFDIIESSGTLHHMKNPLEGLKVLLDILEPHGFLKLAFYSNTGREHVIKAREFIGKKNFKYTSDNLKLFRQEIINEKKELSYKEQFIISEDFYSTSGVRDLLFNVQEHRFTIPEISKILKDLNLEFLGFFFNNDLIKSRYSKLFPDDKKNISLDNWHQFEISNPNTFSAMYQFWVRKIQ